jgi:uncharacterized membrane protein
LFFISFRPNSGGVRFLTPPVFLFLPAYSLVDVFLYPSEFSVGMDNIYNADFTLKWFGYVFALLTILILFYAVFRVSRASALRFSAAGSASSSEINGGGIGAVFRAATALILAISIVHELLAASYALLGRGLIPGYDLLVSAIFLLSDYNFLFLFSLVFLTAFLSAALFISEKKKNLKGINPAVTRKLMAESIVKRRFCVIAFIFLALSALFIQGGKWLAAKNVELVPPVSVTAEDGFIVFPLEAFNDGKLKRYQYKTGSGVEVRFIVIKKPRGGYGVGLDACEICGPTGYYEKKDRVICIRCDVSINIGTIGFDGGCNPVPITFEIRDQKLFIQTSTLEEEESRFR